MSAFSRSALRTLAAAGVTALLVAAPLAGSATATASTAGSAPTAAAAATARSAVQAVDVPGAITAPAVDSVPNDSVPVFVNVQVPAGLTPTSASTTLTPLVPAPLGEAGTVLVTVRGEVRQSVDPTAPAAIGIPLTGDDVVDGQVSIGFTYEPATSTATAAASAATCVPPASATVSLAETTVTTAGEATAPTTLADFFSPALDAVSVTIPDAASDAVRQAGLSAVGALAHVYPAPVGLSLTTASDSARAVTVDPAQGRIVTFAPTTASGDTSEVTTALSTDAAGVPVLTISGPESALPAAGAALASDYLELAGSASTTGLSQTGQAATDLAPTFRDLGAGAQIALAAAGQPDAVVNVSQSAFGGPIGDASVHIVGMHSDVPDSVVATMNVYWNDYLIGSEVLGHTTGFDMTLPVASTRLTAANALKVSLSTQAAAGECVPASSLIPIELYIDNGASTVTGTRGQSLDAGFQRFPQALGQTLPVAFGEAIGEAAAVASAGDIVASLQRNSTVQLDVAVTSATDFRSANGSGLIVGASADDSNALKAPLRLDPFTAIDSDAVEFGVGSTLPYATLEAFEANGRDILMLGGWTPDGATADATDRLQVEAASYALTNPGAWFGLAGDVLVAQSELSDPVALSSNAIVPQQAVTSDYNSYALWAVAVIVVLILAAAVGEATRRRRRRKLAKYVDAQLAADRDRESLGQGPTPPPASGTIAD